MPDARIAALFDTLRRSFDGEAWHGPALADALRGVDARAAFARPIAGAHTIWELTAHLVAWTHEVARRLDGAVPADPVEGDWPAPPHVADDDAWRVLLDRLGPARAALLGAVAVFPPDRLDRLLPARHAATETEAADVTYARMLIGVAEHNAYHAGQIVLLRRAAEPEPST